MPYTVSEVGGLAVAYNTASQEQVGRALRQLDPHLFLDPEVEPNGPHGAYVYLTVKHHVGSGVPPVPVLEWRDWSGPWPLSMAIVDRVREREGKADGALKAALEANRRRQQNVVATVGDQAYDVVRQLGPSVFGKRSVVLPRSAALRMSRSKARNA